MKTTYFILALFLFSSCASFQMITTPKAGDIIEFKGTKEELYLKANAWMVKSFSNSKSVIQFQDKEAGKIMGKYLMKSLATDNEIYSLITISVKDNATKIDIEPMGNWRSSTNCSGGSEKIFAYTSEQAQSDIKVLLDSYRKYMVLKEDVWTK